VDATSSSSLGPSRELRAARSACGRTSWTPPKCSAGRSDESRCASTVSAWNRRASTRSVEGSNASASSRVLEKLACAASRSRTAGNSRAASLVGGEPAAGSTSRSLSRVDELAADGALIRGHAAGGYALGIPEDLRDLLDAGQELLRRLHADL